MEQLSGPQLFLRYAFPCAEEKLRSGRINQNTLDMLETTVKNNEPPSNFSLGHCFPSATISLEKFAREKSKEMWSLETVANFWREHQGSGGDCAVIKAMVCEVNGNAVSVMVDSRMFTVINLYNILDLQIGDMVYLHRHVVIEKVE